MPIPFFTLIDFGLVMSTNRKKIKEIRKGRQLEKERRTASESERKLDLAEIARQ